MKHVTLSVPPPFSDGPQYDDDGLIQGSWPSGLPHEGIEGWTNLGSPKGGKVLCDCVVPDDWPIDQIPNGWIANGSHRWNMVARDEYDEDGNLVKSALVTEVATDYAEYNKHFEDENGDPRTETKRAHVYFGWPEVRD